jgi:hypothetical protein
MHARNPTTLRAHGGAEATSFTRVLEGPVKGIDRVSSGSIHAVGSGRPWRPLGSLLIKRGLISPTQLHHALVVQRRHGGRLGEILFTRGWVTANGLKNALAAQRGLDLSARRRGIRTPDATTDRHRGIMLGKLLVRHDHISEAQLDAALSEQSRSGERLGRILITSGAVSPRVLATALAEQQGLVGVSEALWEAAQARLWSDEPCYEVREVDDGRYQRLYMNKHFLDATDVAFAVLDEWEPDELNVVRLTRGRTEELCWTYPAC